jgi:hypothetical protein
MLQRNGLEFPKPFPSLNESKSNPCCSAVGIASDNESDNTDFVVKQVAARLKEYSAGMNDVIIDADNFPEDGTREGSLRTES